MMYRAWTIWSPYRLLRFLALATDDRGEEAIREMGCTMIVCLGADTFDSEAEAAAHFRAQAGPVFDVVYLWIPCGPDWKRESAL